MDYRDKVIEKLSTLIKVLDTENKLTAQQYDEFSKAMDEYDNGDIGDLQYDGYINYFLYTEEDKQYLVHFNNNVDEDYFYTQVAKAIAFSDLAGTSVDQIVYRGYEKEYVGWQPHMLYEFCDVGSGKIEYSRCFPEWDH